MLSGEVYSVAKLKCFSFSTSRQNDPTDLTGKNNQEQLHPVVCRKHRLWFTNYPPRLGKPNQSNVGGSPKISGVGGLSRQSAGNVMEDNGVCPLWSCDSDILITIFIGMCPQVSPHSESNRRY
jgi:hypothetical protein